MIHYRIDGLHFTSDQGDAEEFGARVARVIITLASWHAPQLETRAYPGQPTHHSTPPVRPCTCAYHVMNTPEGGYLVVPAYRHGLTYADPLEEGHNDEEWTYAVWYPRCPVLSWFTIRRTCPHHGTRVEMYHYPNTTVPRSMLEDYPGSIL